MLVQQAVLLIVRTSTGQKCTLSLVVSRSLPNIDIHHFETFDANEWQKLFSANTTPCRACSGYFFFFYLSY
jgi:hypothetical protein